MRAGGQELQCLNGVGAPLILPAQLLRGGKQRGRWRCVAFGPSSAQAAGLCVPAAAPPPTFNLDFSLLASGTGGKPTQMGVLSVTTLCPLPRPCAVGDSGRTPCRPRPGLARGGQGRGTTRSFPTCPWCPRTGPRWAPSAEDIAGCSCGVHGNNGEPELARRAALPLPPASHVPQR